MRLVILVIAMLTGCTTQPIQKSAALENQPSLEWRLILLQAEVDRLREPQVLAALQQNGCNRAAELYDRMMRGEFVAGSRQGMLCWELSQDAREVPSCTRFVDDCNAELCRTEPHQGCTALRRTEDSHSYHRLKAPAPSADRVSSTPK